MKSESILALGIGNTLLSDDGVGVHAVNQLGKDPALPPGVRCLDGGVLSFPLLDDITASDGLIVLDAAKLGLEPGMIQVFSGDAMDRQLRSGRRSVHEVGLSDLLDIAQVSGRLPPKRALLCIQADNLEWGAMPTPAITRAIPKLLFTAIELIRQWREESPLIPTFQEGDDHVTIHDVG